MKKYLCSTCGGNCEGCFYYFGCDKYNDVAPFEPAYEVVDTASMSVCAGRHDIPQAIDGSIFPNQIDPLNVTGMEAMAEAKLSSLEIKHLDLYVTGLTVAVVAVINSCHRLGITVTLFHHDRESGQYYSQEVVGNKRKED